MSVFLSNLDDYIAPSQACINPMVGKKDKDSSGGKIVLQNDFSMSEYEVKPNLIRTIQKSAVAKVATVSLDDCLACRCVF